MAAKNTVKEVPSGTPDRDGGDCSASVVTADMELGEVGDDGDHGGPDDYHEERREDAEHHGDHHLDGGLLGRLLGPLAPLDAHLVGLAT